MTAVSFNVTAQERATIEAIVARASGANLHADRVALQMDITATHANGCALDLGSLLVADDFDFYHDVLGIQRHIDRRTGRLGNFFLPRCTARDEVA